MTLFNVNKIYFEPLALEDNTGQEVIEKFPNAEMIPVASHWQIPDLHLNPEHIGKVNQVKSQTLVLGHKKGITARPNGRSTDYIAPSHSNGCALSCVFCFTHRRKPYANPITVFTNINQITKYLTDYNNQTGWKNPNQTDSKYTTFDIGENNDCSVDALLSSNVRKLINTFTKLDKCKASFATKYVNKDLLEYDPQQKTRIRFSLSPAHVAKVTDVRTSPVHERVNALESFFEAGYEVHLNFSPVIVYSAGDNPSGEHVDWRTDYRRLFQQINDTVSADFKRQAKCEVIFLTHNQALHDFNMQWHPKGENLIWKPEWQESKCSQNGMTNLRYERSKKARMIEAFKKIHQEEIPWCTIRYIF